MASPASAEPSTDLFSTTTPTASSCEHSPKRMYMKNYFLNFFMDVYDLLHGVPDDAMYFHGYTV